MVQLSHSYMTTGKTIALTRRTFVGKMMSLLFNMLSRFVIAFLPRSNHVLILWLQSPSTVILEPKKIKSFTVSIVSPSICREVMGPDAGVKVLHSICQQIWKTQQWPQDWKRSVFIPVPKKGNAKQYSNYCTTVLISHPSKVMLG